MTVFGGSPREGDWVRATRLVQTGMTDRVLGSGLPSGSRGVVLSRTGSRVTVDFDAGWGTQRVTVPASACRVLRRGGGTAAFYTANRRRTAARIGLAVVLCFPVIEFVVRYVWTTHGVHGLTGALALGAVQGMLDMLTGFLGHPFRSIVYFAVVSLMSRLAFGSHRR